MEVDPRKVPYLKCSKCEDFKNLDYETMKMVIMLGSKYALKAQELGLNNNTFDYDKYKYDIEIKNKDTNEFVITNMEEII